jgi:hypothetical protein
LLGPHSVASPRLRRAHRTEERWIVPSPTVREDLAPHAASHAVPRAASRLDGFAAPTALRWLPAPEALVPVRTGGRLSGFRRGRQELCIARAFGPRRLVGGWWRQPWARDEYELVTTDGGLYRVGRDLQARRWVLLAEAD